VKPANAQLSKNVVPVEIARLELAGGGVATVRNANGTTYSEAAFGKV
jgi:hypothetical protein